MRFKVHSSSGKYRTRICIFHWKPQLILHTLMITALCSITCTFQAYGSVVPSYCSVVDHIPTFTLLQHFYIVYCIPCDSGRVFIGETGRCLSVRISEHKRAVLHLDKRNALAVHMSDHMDHRILWEESAIIEFETNWYQRKIKEAIWIKRTANPLNTDPGLSLNKTWNTMLLKPANKNEFSCQTHLEIDEVPSRLDTTRAAMTAPSLDTK